MGTLVLNCDLGEDEDLVQTAVLMSRIDAANICCGVHAGSNEKTRATLELARQHAVRIGAHPGLASDGGRGTGRVDTDAFRSLLEHQVGLFLQACESMNCTMDYIKLHGRLYHLVERDAALANAYLAFLDRLPSRPAVFALAGGSFSMMAREAGIEVYEELFADRGYLDDGHLVPRNEAGAVLQSHEAAVDRISQWISSGMMPARSRAVYLAAQTICVHSDSPGAVDLIDSLNILIKGA
ncbi:LamB/YcsF family protein [Coraliomargarita parva]|uniref:LamB/YcsF family protein n=1 Tax=Coraliomargarita parva TaxID=3014050 RepID=UPI0022B59C04|nr:LamB/YcsF family protein [Coraliomargarita parva]